MKAFKSTMVVAVMMIIGASAFATQGQVEAVNLELLEGHRVSYSVEPTEEIIDFLTSYGVDIGADDAALGRAIGMLSEQFYVRPDTEEEFDLAGLLNQLILGALSDASREVSDPVFMDIGTHRWAINTSSE